MIVTVLVGIGPLAWLIVRWGATRVYLSAKPVTAEEWLAQSERFKHVNDHLEGIWQRQFDARPATWHLIPKPPQSSMRDVQLFEAEATLASKLLMRSLRYRFRFNWLIKRGHVDRWLNATASLVDPGSDVQITGQTYGVKHEGGVADGLATMSSIACVRLASGARPQPSVSRKANFELDDRA